jgi:hypothetical protein
VGNFISGIGCWKSRHHYNRSREIVKRDIPTEKRTVWGPQDPRGGQVARRFGFSRQEVPKIYAFRIRDIANPETPME